MEGPVSSQGASSGDPLPPEEESRVPDQSAGSGTEEFVAVGPRCARSDSLDYEFREGDRRPVTLGNPESASERGAYMNMRSHVFLNQTFVLRKEDLKLWGRNTTRAIVNFTGVVVKTGHQ